MRHACLAGVLGLAVVVAACGGGGGGGAPTGPSGGSGGSTGGGGGTGGGEGGGASTATITIGADGRVSPADITVARGARVTMVNSHSRPHDMFSDPHPSHEHCPPLNQIGFLAPGQSRTSGALDTPGRCGFHDHNDPTNPGLIGSITIQ